MSRHFCFSFKVDKLGVCLLHCVYASKVLVGVAVERAVECSSSSRSNSGSCNDNNCGSNGSVILLQNY